MTDTITRKPDGSVVNHDKENTKQDLMDQAKALGVEVDSKWPKPAIEAIVQQAKAAQAAAKKSGSSKKSRQSFEDKLAKALAGKSGELTLQIINHVLDPVNNDKPELKKNDKWIWARARTSFMAFYHAGLFTDEVNEAVKEYNWD